MSGGAGSTNNKPIGARSPKSLRLHQWRNVGGWGYPVGAKPEYLTRRANSRLRTRTGPPTAVVRSQWRDSIWTLYMGYQAQSAGSRPLCECGGTRRDWCVCMCYCWLPPCNALSEQDLALGGPPSGEQCGLGSGAVLSVPECNSVRRAPPPDYIRVAAACSRRTRTLVRRMRTND